MSALDDALTQAEIAPYSDMDISPARKELAQLRATVAEQARKLDAANRCAGILSKLNTGMDVSMPRNNLLRIWVRMEIDDALAAWLAANPVTQTDDQDAADRFNDWRKEREEDFSRRIEAVS